MNNKPNHLLRLLMIAAMISVQSPLVEAAEYCGGRFAGETVHWIVPSSPGGGYDTYSRLIAPFYEKHTGAEVIVQNRPGAGGRIGATKIMNATPDGSTLGILNGPGLLMAARTETPPMPNPATDFTMLGRVAQSRHIWGIAADSSLPSLAELLEAGQTRPIVFGTRGPGTLSFVDMVLASRILRLDVDIITGYGGSKDGILGVLRGEIDAVAHSHSSLLHAFESGELRPWLQISDGPIRGTERYDGVPWLAGPDGLAARLSELTGEDAENAAAQAQTLVELTGAGRLIAAPPGLDPELTQCMRDAVYAVLSDPEFEKAAADVDRPLHIARGEVTAERLNTIESGIDVFIPALEQATGEFGK